MPKLSPTSDPANYLQNASGKPEQLAYAVPAPSYQHKVAAGVAIMFGGLCLIVLGGCFLIGVMMITSHGFNNAMMGQPLSNGAIALVIVLYALSALTFIAAVFVLLAGFRALFRVLRS